MPLTAATGPIAFAVERLAATIANATYFLTWTGEATVNDAMDHIYRSSLPLPANGAASYSKAELVAYRPFVLIGPSDTESLRMQRIATGTYALGGKLIAWFEQNQPADTEPDEVERLWQNAIGKLLIQTSESEPYSGIVDQEDVDDRLMINSANVLSINYSDDEEVVTRGAYARALIEFEWGTV